MAAAFVAMNEVYGPIYGVNRAEAATPELANQRAQALADQFIMDVHTHFLRAEHAHPHLRQPAHGGRQGRLEPGAGRQGADDRRPHVRELVQGGLHGQRHESGAGQRSTLRRAGRLVPDQRDEVRGARAHQQGGGLEALPEPRDLHARPARLARARRPRDRRAQAQFMEGLHDRRQHQQEPQQISVADGRREGHVSLLREDPEGREQHRLRAQGPVRALGRAAIPAPAAVQRRARRRQGGEGLAADQLRDLPLGLSLGRRRPRRAGAGRSSTRPAASSGSATSPTSPRSSASTTSTAISARSSRRRRWSSRGCARR